MFPDLDSDPVKRKEYFTDIIRELDKYCEIAEHSFVFFDALYVFKELLYKALTMPELWNKTYEFSLYNSVMYKGKRYFYTRPVRFHFDENGRFDFVGCYSAFEFICTVAILRGMIGGLEEYWIPDTVKDLLEGLDDVAHRINYINRGSMLKIVLSNGKEISIFDYHQLFYN